MPTERRSASAIRQKLILGCKARFFENLVDGGLGEYDDCEGIAWRWQSVDGGLFKAPAVQDTVGATQPIGGNGREMSPAGGLA